MINFRLLSRRSLPIFAPVQTVQSVARASTKAPSHLPQYINSPSFQKTNKINPAFTSLTNWPTTRQFPTTSPTTSRLHTSTTTLRPSPITSSFLQDITMATAPATGIEELVKLASDLSLDQIRDKFPACFPQTNPVDVYRLHVTSVLEKITGVDPKIIYPAVQWSTGLDKGDVVVATPALRVKGKKPDELAKEWSEKVGAGSLHSRSNGSIC